MVANRAFSDEATQIWGNTVLDTIRDTFGSDTPHQSTFLGTQQIRMGGGFIGGRTPDYEAQNARDLQRRIKVLEQLIELIDLQTGPLSSPTPPSQSPDFWPHLHPDVALYSKQKFDDGHFADAVETAFKHLNVKVKDLVKAKSGKELDGASLMKTALSPNAPIISLADLSTESGRNIQQGYMEIFAGSMTGIRNPKAHGLITIDAKRAMHHLFLASLLLQVLDERLP